jgi:hypothetical protein
LIGLKLTGLKHDELCAKISGGDPPARPEIYGVQRQNSFPANLLRQTITARHCHLVNILRGLGRGLAFDIIKIRRDT